MKPKKQEEKISTIRIKESIKKELANLNFVKKGMSYEEIINKILDNYKGRNKK